MTAEQAIERLHAAGPIRAARAALTGREAWLVGGVVRDALLERPLGDVDLAVADDAEEAARAIGETVRGPVFALSAQFGAWRALGRDGTTYDVSPLAAEGIDADLARRDFTVNAMATALTGGPLLDPLGGAGDLDAGVLRLAAEDAYRADPLRPLRLARFVAQLGLEPDARTAKRTSDAASRLSEPSPERVFAELRDLVCAPHVSRGLELADELGVLAAVLPELGALHGIDQSRFHHLDVYDHTLAALEHVIAIERDPAPIFGANGSRVAAVLGEPLGDELTRGQALRFGALFHDIAKPATRGFRGDGRVTFIGHDAEGEQLARAALRRLRTSERLRAFIAALTRHHLALGFLVHEAPLTRRALHGYLRRCQPVGVEVTVLSCADRLATCGEGQERWIDAHLELAHEVMGHALAWRADGAPSPLLRGDELADALGIETGPEVGRLLAELEAAAFAGELHTRDQALALAKRLREDGGR